MEGVVRNAGTHAAGVIITDQPITEYIPLHRPTGGNSEDNPIGAVTQFEMQILDSLGLLKVDFLGLSTLTVMARACSLIRERHGIELDIHSIPVDDPATFELLGRGDVLGVFQVEGVGMRRYLMEMKPRELANVIAMVALYRPGPMEFIPTYIRRMHGEETGFVSSSQTGRHLRGNIRHPGLPGTNHVGRDGDGRVHGIGSRWSAKGNRQEKGQGAEAPSREVHAGAVGNDIDRGTAGDVFDDWENFARYGFNKAHAADYGVIAVQTAYLKAHYPLEYMTALLSVFKHDNDRVALYVADCRRMGIEVRPPDVNTSMLDFSPKRRGWSTGDPLRPRCGQECGRGPIEAILDARQEDWPFRKSRGIRPAGWICARSAKGRLRA